MHLDKLIKFIPKLNILIIGDIMLDEYIIGTCDRVSPEAPVSIINARKREYRLGGAANVANNLAGIGVSCDLIGIVGNDESSEIIKKQLNAKSINSLLLPHSGPTIRKTRIVAQNQKINAKMTPESR